MDQGMLQSLDPSQVKTFREFLTNYNQVTEKCFRACIWDFTSRAVKSQEDRCSTHCVEKFLKANQRVSQRFQEIQMIRTEHLMNATDGAQQ